MHCGPQPGHLWVSLVARDKVMFIVWLSAHRSVIFALMAASLWILANYWYLRIDIRKYLNSRKARSWSADMATRTGSGRGKREH